MAYVGLLVIFRMVVLEVVGSNPASLHWFREKVTISTNLACDCVIQVISESKLAGLLRRVKSAKLRNKRSVEPRLKGRIRDCGLRQDVVT